MNPLRKLKDLRHSIFYKLLMTRDVPLVTLGGTCQWTIHDRGLGPSSIVVCAGAGHDISFEMELMARYGCHILLLDPSPTGIATVSKEHIPAARLEFLPVALAARDGSVDLAGPVDMEEGSFRELGNQSGAALSALCKSLASLMAERGWSRIDLLKIDIEGFEYEVILQMIETKLDIRQLCVEFHHGSNFSHTRRDLIGIIVALRRAGYALIHRANWDHTFLRLAK